MSYECSTMPHVSQHSALLDIVLDLSLTFNDRLLIEVGMSYHYVFSSRVLVVFHFYVKVYSDKRI